MKIALPQWQGRIAPVFDVAGTLLCIDLEPGREPQRMTRSLAGLADEARVAELVSLQADLLICGAISARLQQAMESAGIRVIGFVCGELEEVLAAFEGGQLGLHSFAMPGCRGRGRARGCCGQKGGRGNGCGPKSGQTSTGCARKPRPEESTGLNEDRNR